MSIWYTFAASIVLYVVQVGLLPAAMLTAAARLIAPSQLIGWTIPDIEVEDFVAEHPWRIHVAAALFHFELFAHVREGVGVSIKYFSRTLGGAQYEAGKLEAFGDGPYSVVQGEADESLIEAFGETATVDAEVGASTGVEAVVLPAEALEFLEFLPLVVL